MDHLRSDYPWIRLPLIAGAPMRLIALASFATEISKAGGIGFVGAGNDVSTLASILDEVKKLQIDEPSLKEFTDVLPIGVGFLLWAGEELLRAALPLIEKHKPAAVWLFASNHNDEICTVKDAVEVVKTSQPNVIVVQGTDAGGHGYHKSAGVMPLFPEVDDAVTACCQRENLPKPALLATGGIMDGRGVAAAIALGASGVVMGTRYLASPEANIAQAYRDSVLEATDGGQSTERTNLYDQLRGTTAWPSRYGGRGVLNWSHTDHVDGMSPEENKRLYNEALKGTVEAWGRRGRLTTYAGTGVGLVREVKGAAATTEEVRRDAIGILRSTRSKL